MSKLIDTQLNNVKDRVLTTGEPARIFAALAPNAVNVFINNNKNILNFENDAEDGFILVTKK